MAQSPRAGAARAERDGLERAKRLDPEERQGRRRGEFHARRAARGDHERRAVVEPLGERRSGHQRGDVLRIHDGSVGGVHGGEAISLGEIRLGKGRNDASGDSASILTKSLTLSLAFRPCRKAMALRQG